MSIPMGKARDVKNNVRRRIQKIIRYMSSQ